MKKLLLAVAIGLTGLSSTKATVLQFNWTGSVTSTQVFGNPVGIPIHIGDSISVSYLYNDNSYGVGTSLSAPGGGTGIIYSVNLKDLRFKAGDYLYAFANQLANLDYRNDSFSQDFINFTFHTDEVSLNGPFFGNPQLIAQGPQSALSIADASEGFPYANFPTIRTTFGFGDLAGDNTLIFGNLSVSVTPIPETTSWAMFIGGFGLVGATMRRKTVNASFG